MAMVMIGDAAVLLWPNVEYRGFLIALAAFLSVSGVIPLVARWGPFPKGQQGART